MTATVVSIEVRLAAVPYVAECVDSKRLRIVASASWTPGLSLAVADVADAKRTDDRLAVVTAVELDDPADAHRDGPPQLEDLVGDEVEVAHEPP